MTVSYCVARPPDASPPHRRGANGGGAAASRKREGSPPDCALPRSCPDSVSNEDYSRVTEPAYTSPRPPLRGRRVSVLLSEVRAPELARLRGREPWSVESVHNLVGEFPLIGLKRRRIVPAQSSSNVLLDYPLRASGLVGAPMELLHLFQQRLEHVVIDGHRGQTLLAVERPLVESLTHAPLVLPLHDAELALQRPARRPPLRRTFEAKGRSPRAVSWAP